MAIVDASAARPVGSAVPPPRGRTRLLGAGQLLIVPVVVVALWEIAALAVGDVAVASPVQTVRAIVDGIEDGWLAVALGKTAIATLASFAIAVALGVAFGLLLGVSRFWGAVLEDPFVWVYAIPKIALYPIFLLFLGLTFDARVAFAVFHGFIPLLLTVANGLRGVRPVYYKVARAYRLSRRQLFVRVLVPSTLPAIILGLRYCFSLTFLGVVLAEMFAAKEGTGYELLQAIGLHQVPRTFGIALVLTLIALIINAAFIAVSRVVERSRRASQP